MDDDKLNLERAIFLRLLKKRQMALRPETDLPLVILVAGCFGVWHPPIHNPEAASYEKPPP